jgi:hypothetical protein
MRLRKFLFSFLILLIWLMLLAFSSREAALDGSVHLVVVVGSTSIELESPLIMTFILHHFNQQDASNTH